MWSWHRAHDRQAQEAAADDVDPVVDHVVEVVHEPAPEGQEAEGRQRAFVAQGKPVGGELFDQETVEREVAVERSDHVVAVGVGPVVVGVLEEDVAAGVGIAGDVEPVAAHRSP